MNDLSKIKLPNNTIVYIRDNEARNSLDSLDQRVTALENAPAGSSVIYHSTLRDTLHDGSIVEYLDSVYIPSENWVTYYDSNGNILFDVFTQDSKEKFITLSGPTINWNNSEGSIQNGNKYTRHLKNSGTLVGQWYDIYLPDASEAYFLGYPGVYEYDSYSRKVKAITDLSSTPSQVEMHYKTSIRSSYRVEENNIVNTEFKKAPRLLEVKRDYNSHKVILNVLNFDQSLDTVVVARANDTNGNLQVVTINYTVRQLSGDFNISELTFDTDDNEQSTAIPYKIFINTADSGQCTYGGFTKYKFWTE